MTTRDQYIICDGDLFPANEPVAPATSRGLMYGDGVFETFKTYSGKTFLLDEHIQRLTSGLELLNIRSRKELIPENIRRMVFRLLEKQQLLEANAIVRLQVWRGGGRGYHPQEDAPAHFSITASACPADFSPPILATVSTKRIPSPSLPAKVKHTNGINYILASREASQKGADDALMQTVDGWISETTIANIFWSQGKTIFTPDNDCDLLPGITRNLLFELISDLKDWKLNQGKYSLTSLENAEAVWMCNSVREILPVKQVDDNRFDVRHPVITLLQQQFEVYREINMKTLDKDG